MRKERKKQAEGFVGLLGQCHEEIGKAIGDKRIQTALDLLGQCREGAASLGAMIERLEGADTPTIPLLKQYAGAVCQAQERLRSGQAPEAVEIYEELGNQLKQIRDSVKKDIRARLEAVFLPYKASMWDSLESIWRAAREDGDCDAYVIPIPYYDKNADGSLGEEHYEGGLYPDYVPITKYNAYHFEGRKPDMVFIHNPYDECNYITSVHPFFYSKNLKQSTGMLVYVPYFILGEVDPEDKAGVEGMKHFCTVPGAYHADKVVVQSEEMRRIYIDVLTEESGCTGQARRYWERKIDGTGSPKYDSLQGALSEAARIPEAWLRIMRKKDGRLKKLVLYNTGVTAALRHGEGMLEKIQSVLEVFRERQEEVALLWRPHPLLKAALASMRPRLWEGYQDLVEGYKGQGWGIYDDTADLDRAIAASDAYYGDESSLVPLFEKTGKPIMIQDPVYGQEEWVRRLRMIDFLEDGDNIWFCALYTNGLFCFHKPTGKTRAVCFLPAETLHESYRAICKKDGKVYLAPIYANDIAIFDLIEQTLTLLPLELDSEGCRRMPPGNQAKFSNAYIYGSYVFFTPLSFGAVVRLDTRTNDISYFNDFIRQLLPLAHNENAFWFSHSCAVEGKLYMPASCADALVEFDMETGIFLTHRLGEEAAGHTMICHDGEDFWILGSPSDSIIRWNRRQGVIGKAGLKASGKYNFIFPYGDDILRIPCQGDLTCSRISRKGGRTIPGLKLRIEKNSKRDVSGLFEANSGALCAKVLDGKIHVFTPQRDSLCIFDKTGKCIQEYVFEVSDDDMKPFIRSQGGRLKLLAKESQGNVIFTENFYESISLFLGYLLECRAENDARERKPGMYGKRIFEKIKEEVLNG